MQPSKYRITVSRSKPFRCMGGTEYSAQQYHITVFLGMNHFDVWEERIILPSNTTLPCF